MLNTRGGVITDVNKYITYSIFSHFIVKAEGGAGRQLRLFVGYLYIYLVKLLLPYGMLLERSISEHCSSILEK